MKREDKLAGVLTPVGQKKNRFKFLILPKGTGKYAQFAGYRCVSESNIAKMGFFGQIKKYADEPDFEVFGLTEELCKRFTVEMKKVFGPRCEGVKMAPFLKDASKKKAPSYKGTAKKDDGEKES